MIEDNKSYKEILIALGFDPSVMSTKELENFCDVISNIRVGRYYSDISKNYNFNSDKGRYDQKFTEDQIHFICKSIEDGMDTTSILLKLGIDKNTDKYRSYRGCVQRIRNKVQFVNISKNYNF